MLGFKNPFRKRKRLAQVRQADPYQYTELTQKFRTQVWHIWDKVGTSDSGYIDPRVNRIWQDVYESTILDEGIPNDVRQYNSPLQWCCIHLMEAQTEDALKLIERSFQVICRYFPIWESKQAETPENTEKTVTRTFSFPAGYGVESSIDTLNRCFKQNGLGYEFVEGQLIEINSAYNHSEIVVPAITLLRDAGFTGPNKEFMKAHEYHRNGDYENAITWAERAFESTMKAICEVRGWSPPKTKLEKANAGELINLILKEELVDPVLQTHLSGLKNVLADGLPTVRNNLSAHGSGREYTPGEAHVASYALHLAAANIVFLVEAHNAKP
jgi:hypothetical protein